MKLLNGAVVLTLLWTTAACAADRTPVQVVEDHVVAMKKADVDLIMSDYADDTVVITPEGLVAGQQPAKGPGVYSGIANARKVFVTLTNKDNIGPVRSMVARIEPLGDDVALLHWVQFQGTPQQVTGEDVFVVRNGKIAFQDIVVLSQPQP